MLLLKSVRTFFTALTIVGILAIGYVWAGPKIERIRASLEKYPAEQSR